MFNEFVQPYSSNCITDTNQYILYAIGMKRKLKDPKKWEKRKNKLLITVAKIKRPPQDETKKNLLVI